MTALEAIATHRPEHSVSIDDLADSLGLTRMQVRLFRKFHGFDRVPLDPGGTLLDLLRPAVAGLPLAGREQQVRYLVHARNMPFAAPYPLSPLHDLRDELGLSHAVAFTVSHHACATALIAIDVAGQLLAADGDEDGLALVLAGEKAFTRDAQFVPGTSIFGEVGGACLVSAGGRRDRLLAFANSARGEFNGRFDELPELAAQYELEYPVALTDVLFAAMKQAGLALTDLSLILPHNVNAVSWVRLCRRIDFPVERVVLDNVPVTGHAFCADFFVNYQTATGQGLLRPGDRYLVAAAGQGATFSAMVFEH